MKKILTVAIAALSIYVVFYFVKADRQTTEEKNAVAEKVKAAPWYSRLLRLAADYNVDPKIIAAIVSVESSGNPAAIGALGEKGLMQLTYGAMRDVQEYWRKQNPVTQFVQHDPNLLDPYENLEYGVAYFTLLKVRNGGNQYEAIKRYNGIGPMAEQYREKVLSFTKFF